MAVCDLRLSSRKTRTRGLGVVALGLMLPYCGGCSTYDSFAAQQHNSQGVDYFNQGYYPAAESEFKEAMIRNPQQADYYYNLANAYHRQGDAAKAEFYYNESLDRNPSHKQCYHALAVLLTEQGRNQDAFALLEEWNDLMPYSAEPSVELAWLHRANGDLPAAQGQLQHALEIAPRHPQAIADLGQVYESMGRTDRAIALYDRSLSIDRNQPVVATRLANLRAIGGTGPGGVRTRFAETQNPQGTRIQ